MAPQSEDASIHYYKLTEEAAPWFHSDGVAEQFIKYKSDGRKYTVKELVDEGILDDITYLVESGEIKID